jgi:branched-chain amino acid transport system permease protein
MYAYNNPFSADTFYLTLTFYSIAVLVIGGQMSLWGAVLGTTVVSVFSQLMRHAESGVELGELRSRRRWVPPRSASAWRCCWC